MKRVLLSLLLIVLMVGIALAGCAKPAPSPAPTPAPAPPKTLDIGIVTPLTGPTAFLGTQMKNAVLLAIDDQNVAGGVTIAGQKYVLDAIIRDSKADVVVGRSTAEELVFHKKVKVIAGPFLGDAIGAQSITEKNKVIGFFTIPVVPSTTGADKPYTFFFAPPMEQLCNNPAAYIQKFHPEAKTVLSLAPDLPDLPVWELAIKTICPRYGLNWLGMEKFPVDVTDFMPVI